MQKIALNCKFGVMIDSHDLGEFQTVSGLEVRVDVSEVCEGGNPYFAYQIPGQLRYSNIILSRPLDEYTKEVMEWLKTMAEGVKRCSAVIYAYTGGDGAQPIGQWTLQGAFLVGWTASRFDVDDQLHATETLELAHHGFVFS